RRKIGFLLLTNKAFRLWRWFGVHVTPVHFYSPVPDLRELTKRQDIWRLESSLPGVAMNDATQLRLMRDVFQAHPRECDFPDKPTPIPHEYHTANIYFGYASAVAMYSMIRHFRPARVVEVGAGNTTYVIAAAARANEGEGRPAEVIAVDPY